MTLTSKEIQLQFNGFLNTPNLWKNDAVLGLHQFEIVQESYEFDFEIDSKLRLGKYIERFVFFQLQQEKTIKIIAENIQIQQEKRTLGELDCILTRNKKPIHLEIVYKFYLYDDSVGDTEIDHFIGPNRKDSLIEKLNKLKEKQFPLLYSTECRNFIKTLKLNVEEIKQQVYFKAQLFVPFLNLNLQLSQLNEDCIVGFYINRKELDNFTRCKFFIPNKKDWLIAPHQHVKWIEFHQFKIKDIAYFEREFSPLIWIKRPNGTISKAFLIWW